MNFPTTDHFLGVPPSTRPPYDSNNPITRLMREVEAVELAAEREHYEADTLQYLFPYRELTLYGPSGDEWQRSNPAEQDNKNDFQKQNIQDFKLADFHLVRGYACAGEWTGSFVKICYRATPTTALGRLTAGSPGEYLNIFVKIGSNQAPGLIKLPLNARTGCYETELWAFSGANFRDLLSEKGQNGIDRGFIQSRPDLVKGVFADWQGPDVDQERDALNRSLTPLKSFSRAPEHAMHPTRALRLELAFANQDVTQWDSNNGNNYRVEFDMLFRGWRNHLAVGVSANPHGGVGYLEYRNLVSNYFDYEKERRTALGGDWKNELGRDLIAGNFDANTWHFGESNGSKVSLAKREHFMAVDYMDLHILQPDCGIGIHRHRDNQEVFLMLQGKGLMVLGDWAEFPRRERAFEIRTLLAGDLAICKTGQLHALFNSTDEICLLFMFGGYD